MSDIILSVRNLRGGYGPVEVLHRIDLDIQQESFVAVIGPNGAGKSTLLRAIFGMLPFRSGSIHFSGTDISTARAEHNVRSGLVMVPQGNRVFNDLTVSENLDVGGHILPSNEVRRRMRETIFEQFPILAERRSQRAGTLSGGEKQRLAIGRALMLDPKVMLLDEPSLGLSEDQIPHVLNHLDALKREQGTTMVVVEQNVHEVLKVAHRVVVMKLGRIVFDGSPSDPELKVELKKVWTSA